jgi:hypothetical protein
LKKLARSLRVTNNAAAFRGDLVESMITKLKYVHSIKRELDLVLTFQAKQKNH